MCLFCIQFFISHNSKLVVKLKVAKVVGIMCFSKTFYVLKELKEEDLVQKLT